MPKARECGDEAKEVRILNTESKDLSDEEDDTSYEKTPQSAGVERLDQEIGSDAWGDDICVSDRTNDRLTKDRSGREGERPTAQKPPDKTAD